MPVLEGATHGEVVVLGVSQPHAEALIVADGAQGHLHHADEGDEGDEGPHLDVRRD